MDIDPEILHEFQEQLKQMTDLMGQNNSAMEAHLNSMKNLSDNSEAINKNTEANKNASQAVKDLTAAERQAMVETAKTLQVYNQAIEMSTRSLMSFGRAALSGEQGVGKFGAAAIESSMAVSKLTENMGPLAQIAGLLVQAFAKLEADALKLVDQTTGFRDALNKTNGTISASLEDISKLSAEARFSGERMQVLQQAISKVSGSMVALGNTSGEGATKFMKMAAMNDIAGKSADSIRKKFEMLGVSQDELIDGMGKYVEMQTASGNAYKMQHMTMGQLQKESLAYVETLNRVRTLTGENADQQQKEQLEVQNRIEEQAKEVALQAQVARGGPGAAAAQKLLDQLRALDSPEMVSRIGATNVMQLQQLLRSGGAPSAFSAPLTVSDPNVLAQLNAYKEGKISALDVGEQVLRGQTNMLIGPGSAIAEYSPEQLETVGVNKDAVAKMLAQKTGTGVGPTLQQMDDAEKKREESIGKNIDPVTGKPYSKEASDKADINNQMLKMQAMYQENLQKLIDTQGVKGLVGTIAAFSAAVGVFSVASKIFLAGATMNAGGSVLNLFKGGGAEAAGSGGMFSKLGKMFKGGGAAAEGEAAVGAAEGAGVAGAAEGATAVGAAEGIGGLAAGGEALGAGALIAPEIVLPALAIGAAGYGLYKGYQWLTGGDSDKTTAQPTTASSPDQTTPGTPDISNDQATAQQAGNSVDQSSIDANVGGGTGLMGAFNRLNFSINQLIQSVNNLADQYRNTSNGSLGVSGDTNNSNTPTQFGGNMDAVLATIRKQESGSAQGNYTAQNPSSTASGAYQFTNPTWQGLTRKYGIGTQYATAASAPASIQDQVAANRVQEILAQSGGDVSRVPVAWYTGNINGTNSTVNSGQVSQYAQQWMGTYRGIAGEMGGTGRGGFGSGLGGPQDLQLTSVGAQGKSVQVAPVAAQAFQSLLNFLTQAGYRIKSLGGYSNRDVVGMPGVKSAHAKGLALDINPDSNPLGNALISDLPPEAIQYAHNIGLGWGGDWRTRKDAMHFSAQRNEGGWVQAANGGLFSGPDSGYPALLHGTEMIVPVDNAQHRAGSKLEELNNYTKSETLKQFSKVADSDTTRQMKDLMDKTSSVSGQGGTQIYDPASDRNLRLATDDNNLLKEIRDGINKMHNLANKTATEKSAKASKTKATTPKTEKSLLERHPSLSAPMGYLGGKMLANIGSIWKGVKSVGSSLMSKAKSALGTLAEKFGFGSKTVAKSMTGEEARAAAKMSAREAAIAEAKAARSSMGGLGAGAPAKAAAEAAEKAGGSFLSKLAKPLAKIGGRALGPLVAGGFSGYEEYQADKKKGDSTGTSLKKAGIVGTGAAVGAGVGELAGGALGSLLGPVGTVLGATAGGAIGSWLGEKGGKLLADYMVKDDAKKKAAPKPQAKQIAHKASNKTPELEDPRIFAIPKQTRPNLAVANVRLDNSSGTYAPNYITSKIHNEPAAGQNMQQHRPQEFAQQQQNNENTKHFEKLGSHLDTLNSTMTRVTRAIEESHGTQKKILQHVQT